MGLLAIENMAGIKTQSIGEDIVVRRDSKFIKTIGNVVYIAIMLPVSLLYLGDIIDIYSFVIIYIFVTLVHLIAVKKLVKSSVKIPKI